MSTTMNDFLSLTPRQWGLVAAGTAISLVEHRDLGPVGKQMYRVGLATVSGFAAVTGDDVDIDVPTSTIALGAGAATLALAPLIEKFDGATMDTLERWGLPKPRLWSAALTGLTLWASEAMTARSDRNTVDLRDGTLGDSDAELSGSFGFEDLPQVPLDDVARRIIRAMLTHDQAPSQAASVLLEQLESATSEEGIRLYRKIEVPGAKRLAVPHGQTWPVYGVFVREGHELRVELTIQQGRLAWLEVSPHVYDMSDEENFNAALDAWHSDPSMPTLDQLEFEVDSATV